MNTDSQQLQMLYDKQKETLQQYYTLMSTSNVEDSSLISSQMDDSSLMNSSQVEDSSLLMTCSQVDDKKHGPSPKLGHRSSSAPNLGIIGFS